MKKAFVCLLLITGQTLVAQIDSVKTTFFDKENKRHSCVLLLPNKKKQKELNRYKYVEIVDSLGTKSKLVPEDINGYWLSKDRYMRSFTINYNDKKLSFFAGEITKGAVDLYEYNAEATDNKPIYIFRKKSETDFNFIYQNVYTASEYGTAGAKPTADGKQSGNSPMKFTDEKPYLDHIYQYLSDCQSVRTKMKSEWYTFSSIETMFKDYNKCK